MVDKSTFGEIQRRARRIKLMISDCDGVLTDGGVYYSEKGEALKRFSLRDGMGVERLRKFAEVETAIVTGENSPIVQRRAEKLKIKELHLGIKDKPRVVREICDRMNIKPEEIAYIGDDTNDVAAMKMIGLSACPSDAFATNKRIAHYICMTRGGFGAFREFAELIIAAKNSEDQPSGDLFNEEKS